MNPAFRGYEPQPDTGPPASQRHVFGLRGHTTDTSHCSVFTPPIRKAITSVSRIRTATHFSAVQASDKIVRGNHSTFATPNRPPNNADRPQRSYQGCSRLYCFCSSFRFTRVSYLCRLKSILAGSVLCSFGDRSGRRSRSGRTRWPPRLMSLDSLAAAPAS